MILIHTILVALAAYRLAHMIVAEDGPFDIFVRWRTFLYVRARDTWLWEGFNCVLCVSFWLAWLFSLLVWSGWREYVLMSFAGAGIGVVLQRIVYR